MTAVLPAAASSRLVARALADWGQVANHRGRPVSRAGGPALVAGVLAGLAAAPAGPPDRAGSALAAVVVGAAAVGFLDDLSGSQPRGLAGHLRAARAGRVTGGLVKLVALPALGWATAPGRAGGWGQRACDSVLVAAAANLVNLLDVRPGRALKAVLAASVLLAGAAARAEGWPAAPLALACAAGSLLPGDVGERWMLGDCGANPAGAVLGAVATRQLTPPGRRRVAGALVALTLLAERVSLSQLICRVPPLRVLDEWGRIR